MADVPIAISRLGNGDSREAQNARAVRWLLAQPGGAIALVTPRRAVESASLKRLIAQPGVTHHAWRGYHGGYFDRQRVFYSWPDRERLYHLWNVEADAIAVIEWGTQETAEWIKDVNPIRLLPGEMIMPTPRGPEELDPLPNGVDAILESVAAWAAGYDSGLKWSEEDKLKADMMNRSDHWLPITGEQVRCQVPRSRHARGRWRYDRRLPSAPQGRRSLQREDLISHVPVQLVLHVAR